MRILFIPDCQCKPGVPLEHLTWAGKAIVDYKPDVIVNAGDFADFPSLSSYETKGSKYFEGKRYKEDVEAAKTGMKMLLAPLREYQAKLKKGKKAPYEPRMVLTLGNHENRLTRAINSNPILDGTISLSDLEYEDDWEVSPFLVPVFIEGIAFNHYFSSGVMKRATANPAALLRNLHMSCIVGHQQGKQVAYGKRADGKALCAIICGSFYQHTEDFMDTLGNQHWHGLVLLNEVHDGAFDECFLSMDYLRRKYGNS